MVLLSPSELYLSAQSSDVVVIEVECRSPFELKQLLIKSRMEGEYSVTELDSTITGKVFYFQYEYLVPELSENLSITLEFNLLDASNEMAKNFRVIEVKGTVTYLTETAGHEMFSENSGRQNAYNLVMGTPQYLNLSSASELHIADTSKSETLLNRWVSPAGIEFVKFNGLDYANCTDVSAKYAYNAGLKLEFIDKLSEGDTFVTKIRVKVNLVFKDIYAVIKITKIIDEPGSENDRYVFNLKKLQFLSSG